MHPQTLRMYEARGLIEPKRSPKGTRLYSQEDVEQLRRIQEMTAELGLNLAGVERVLDLEAEIERDARAHRGARARGAAARRCAWPRSSSEVRRSFRAELVPYRGGAALVRAADAPLPVPRAQVLANEVMTRCRPDRFTIKSQEALAAAGAARRGARATRRSRRCTCSPRCCRRRPRPPAWPAPTPRRRRAAGARQARRPAAARCAPRSSDALDELPTLGEGSARRRASPSRRSCVAVLRAAEARGRRALRPVHLDRAPAARARRRPGPRRRRAARASAPTHERLLAGARGGARLAPRHRPEPRGEVPGARALRPRPHRRPPSRASSTR